MKKKESIDRIYCASEHGSIPFRYITTPIQLPNEKTHFGVVSLHKSCLLIACILSFIEDFFVFVSDSGTVVEGSQFVAGGLRFDTCRGIFF